MQIIEPKVTLEHITPDLLDVLEDVARTCYESSNPGRDEEGRVIAQRKLLDYLIQRGHESILEFGILRFRIITDRGITHELVRHRIASFAQRSTRYVGEDRTGGIRVIRPKYFYYSHTKEEYDAWVKAIEASEDSYFSLRESGVSKQVARSILPTCLATEIVVQFNLRSFRNFLKLRSSILAHPDMRDIAHDCYESIPESYHFLVEDVLAPCAA